MKIVFLLGLVLFCAINADEAIAKGVSERACIEHFVKGSLTHKKCEEIIESVIDRMFQFDDEVLMNYSSNKSCFLPFLMKHEEILTFYLHYLHGEFEQPGKSEDLKLMVEKAVRAIDSLCSRDLAMIADFDVGIYKLSSPEYMKSHCIYVYGVENRMIDERIFNLRNKTDAEDCKPYREFIEKLFRKKTNNEIGHFDSELDECVHRKVSKLESRKPMVIFISILAHRLSSKQEGEVRQKVLVYSNQVPVFTLICTKEISDSRQLKSYQPKYSKLTKN